MSLPLSVRTLGLATTLLATRSLHGQDQWADRFQPNNPSANTAYTAGWYLEDQFDPILSACGISLPLKNDRPLASARTSIPLSIQGYLKERLRTPVTVQITHSLPALYAYVFQDTTVTGSNGRYSFTEAVNPSNGRLVNMSLVRDPAMFVPEGFTNLQHTQSCASVVAQSLNGSAKLSLGPIAIETALRQEFNNAARTMLGVVQSNFASPLLVARNQGRAHERTTANMLLWEWYSRNNPAANQKFYLIGTFNGIAVVRFQHQDRNFETAAKVNLGAQLPVASGTGAVSGSLTQRSATTIEAYSTAAYMEPHTVRGRQVLLPSVTWQRLPTLASIVTDLNQLTPALVTASLNPVLMEDEINRHQVQLGGLPARLCNTTSWTAIRSGGTTEPTLLSADTSAVTDEAPIQQCVFTVGFQPSTETIHKARTSSAINLSYTLQTRSSTVTNVVLSVGPIPFSVSVAPDVHVDPAGNRSFKNDQITRTGGQTTNQLAWTFDYLVTENRADDLRWNVAPVAIGAKIRCSDKEIYEVAATPQLLSDSRRVRFTVNYNFDEGGLLTATQTRSCDFVTDVRFPMDTPAAPRQRYVVKTLPTVQVYFPQLRQPQQ